MEALVKDVEALCDAFEEIPQTVTDRIRLESFFGASKPLCIPATVANIRVFYYVSQFYNPPQERSKAFAQLKFLLTDERSNWNTMNDDEKLAIIYALRAMFTEVMVFSL